jgi:anti-sigma regulatory factor (Ser/Thr protein kinase)
VEQRTTQLDSGPDQLLERLAAATGSAGALVDAAVRPGAVDRHDDLAVLAVRRTPPAPPPDLQRVDRRYTYLAELPAASRARRDLRRDLLAAGVRDDDVDALLSAASEAVNNAVEHAQSPTLAEVHVRVVVDAHACRIVVQDFGTWRARPPALDRGRGSALMAAAGHVRVVPSDVGTSVTIERTLA